MAHFLGPLAHFLGLQSSFWGVRADVAAFAVSHERRGPTNGARPQGAEGSVNPSDLGTAGRAHRRAEAKVVAVIGYLQVAELGPGRVDLGRVLGQDTAVRSRGLEGLATAMGRDRLPSHHAASSELPTTRHADGVAQDTAVQLRYLFW